MSNYRNVKDKESPGLRDESYRDANPDKKVYATESKQKVRDRFGKKHSRRKNGKIK